MPSYKLSTLLGAFSVLVWGLLVTTTLAFAASQEKVLYSFAGGTDGGYPQAGLISDAAGNLYGTTVMGGANNAGTVFELKRGARGTWTESALYSFQDNGQDGFGPQAGLTFDGAGDLYGTTSSGGASGSCDGDTGCGTVFELIPGANGTWTEKVLYSFQNDGQDGVDPQASLTFDSSGNLYGTTQMGGAAKSACHGNGCGTIFELTPGANGTWTEKVLYSFNFFDGAAPSSSLILDKAGNLYGSASSGNHPDGNVFRLSPSKNGKWNEKILHTFIGKDGSTPYASLIFDAAGNLYSTTFGGGMNGNGGAAAGVAFKLQHGTGEQTVLHSFGKSSDGAGPRGKLTFDAAGNLYGTTWGGGASGSGCNFNGCGTVFKLVHGKNGAWTEKVLHSFDNNGTDGYWPYAGLIFDKAGDLYGTTSSGGASGSGCGGGGCGTVFEIIP